MAFSVEPKEYFFIGRMSGWDESDTGYEDFDPNKDYSVQVQKNDGGLSSTQVSLVSKDF